MHEAKGPQQRLKLLDAGEEMFGNLNGRDRSLADHLAQPVHRRPGDLFSLLQGCGRRSCFEWRCWYAIRTINYHRCFRPSCTDAIARARLGRFLLEHLVEDAAGGCRRSVRDDKYFLRVSALRVLIYGQLDRLENIDVLFED